MAETTEAKPTISVQRYALHKGRLICDMTGDWVRYENHMRAARTERQLAVLAVQQAEEKASRPASEARPEATPAALDDALKKLKEAVAALREIGWDDGDIVFAADLKPTENSTFVAGRPDSEVPDAQ